MKKFQLKEILLIPLIVSLIFILGYLVLPLMNMMPLPAFRGIVVAPIYGVGVTLLTRRIKKLGVVTLIGFLIGGLLSNFFFWMIFISFLGGFFTDLLIYILFRGYQTSKSVIVAAGLFPALQIPLTFIVAALFMGGPSGELLRQPLIVLAPTLLTYVLGALPAKGIDRVMESRGL